MNFETHFRETFKLAIPVSIGQLGHMMLGVVDSIMVGKIGSVPLAAASLVNGLFILILIFGIGISLAVTPLVAIANGENDTSRCGVILRQSLMVNLFFSIFLTVVTYISADFIIYLNQPEEVAELSKSYLKILSLSILPFMLFQTYRQFIEGLGDTKPAMYIAIIANLVNAFGNWVFIYGNLGMPELGLDGAGYASFSTRVFMALCIVPYVMKSGKYKVYDPSLRFRSINIPVIKKILGIGIPSGFQYFFEIASFSFSAIMIGWIGSSALASHQIAISLASITYMIILGISAAGTIRVGNAFGRKDFQSVRRTGFTAQFSAVIIMVIFGISFIIFREELPVLFVKEYEVISLASSLLIVAAFFQIFDGAQAVGLGILRGLTDVKVPLIFTFISYWIIGVPSGYVLGFIYGFGTIGIWIGFLIGLVSASFFFTLRFHIKTRGENIIYPKTF